jgi:aspartyl-tRNA synthetase
VKKRELVKQPGHLLRMRIRKKTSNIAIMKKYSIIETLQKVDSEVELYGWVHSKRDHKKIVFLDLRDRTGLIQVVGNETFKELSHEDVVKINGLVKKRPEKLVNPNIKTGTIELEAHSFEILGKAKTPPIPIDSDGNEIEEDIRLKYRYLDLRRARLTNMLKLRSDYVYALREGLKKT